MVGIAYLHYTYIEHLSLFLLWAEQFSLCHAPSVAVAPDTHSPRGVEAHASHQTSPEKCSCHPAPGCPEKRVCVKQPASPMLTLLCCPKRWRCQSEVGGRPGSCSGSQAAWVTPATRYGPGKACTYWGESIVCSQKYGCHLWVSIGRISCRMTAWSPRSQ